MLPQHITVGRPRVYFETQQQQRAQHLPPTCHATRQRLQAPEQQQLRKALHTHGQKLKALELPVLLVFLVALLTVLFVIIWCDLYVS